MDHSQGSQLTGALTYCLASHPDPVSGTDSGWMNKSLIKVLIRRNMYCVLLCDIFSSFLTTVILFHLSFAVTAPSVGQSVMLTVV